MSQQILAGWFIGGLGRHFVGCVQLISDSGGAGDVTITQRRRLPASIMKPRSQVASPAGRIRWLAEHLPRREKLASSRAPGWREAKGVERAYFEQSRGPRGRGDDVTQS
jgi:hypothetical protein